MDNCLEKSVSQILTRLNFVSYHMTQQLHSQVHLVEHILLHENWYTMLRAELITMAKKWKVPKYPSLKNGYIKCGISIQWDIIQK